MSSTDDTDSSPLEDFAATEALVLARLGQLECIHQGRTITAHQYVTKEGRAFHFPLPFIAGAGYSADLLKLLANVLVLFALVRFHFA